MPGTEVLTVQPAASRATGGPAGLSRIFEGNALYILLLGVATYALYAPALGFPFVYDDIFQIVQNGHLDSWHFLPLYFTKHAWSHLPGVAVNFYRPFFLLWMRLNNLVFGHEPAAWHLTTILLHLLAMVLVYRVALTPRLGRAAAALAALLFAVHPVQVESVAWVSGATEPLEAAFFLGSFLCYLRGKPEPARLWRLASLGMFAGALLVKETAAVLPGVIAAYELTLGEESEQPAQKRVWDVRQAFARFIPYAIILGVYLAVRWWVLHGLSHSATTVPLWSSLLTLPWLLCFYLRLLVWPAGLSPLYDVVYVTRFMEARCVVPLLVLLGIAVSVAWAARKEQSRRMIFFAFWFLLTLAPALAIFCLALPAEGFHDRYLYLPSVAFALVVGVGFEVWFRNTKRVGRVLAILAAVGAVGALAITTRHQIPYWQSNYSLFGRASAIAPQNEIAGLNFAAELVRNQDYRQALLVSQRAILYNPQSARALGSAAAAAFYLADYHQAEAYYARSVELDPTRGNLQYYLGLSRLRLGSYDSAEAALQAALRDDPEQRGVHYALGLVFAHTNRWQAACGQFATEAHNDPGNGAVQTALRNAEAHLARPDSSAPQTSR